MESPIWVRRDVVFAVHKRQIAEHGGGEGIRDQNLLDSALSKPKNLFFYGQPEPDLAALAASYAYGLARNHPFVDGNKRTAFIVCRLFLELNGQSLQASATEKYEAFIKLAAGHMTESELGDWIRKHV